MVGEALQLKDEFSLRALFSFNFKFTGSYRRYVSVRIPMQNASGDAVVWVDR